MESGVGGAAMKGNSGRFLVWRRVRRSRLTVPRFIRHPSPKKRFKIRTAPPSPGSREGQPKHVPAQSSTLHPATPPRHAHPAPPLRLHRRPARWHLHLARWPLPSQRRRPPALLPRRLWPTGSPATLRHRRRSDPRTQRHGAQKRLPPRHQRHLSPGLPLAPNTPGSGAEPRRTPATRPPPSPRASAIPPQHPKGASAARSAPRSPSGT